MARLSNPRTLALALALALAVPVPAGAAADPSAGPAAGRAAAVPAADRAAAPERVAALEARVKALEDELAAVRQQLAGLGQQGAERERAAEEMVADIGRLSSSLDLAPARARLDEFDRQYANTAAARKLARLRDELAVVGRTAPQKVDVETWFQGGPQVPAGTATLYVFFETWCPHCKREVSRLQAMHEALKDQGLVIVGLTKLTRGSTGEQIKAFVADGKVTYPVAKETGSMSQFFNVTGVPAAAIVKDGKVVWRGNPARLDAEKLKALL